MDDHPRWRVAAPLLLAEIAHLPGQRLGRCVVARRASARIQQRSGRQRGHLRRRRRRNWLDTPHRLNSPLTDKRRLACVRTFPRTSRIAFRTGVRRSRTIRPVVRRWRTIFGLVPNSSSADDIAARLSAERQGARERPTSALTVEQYLIEVWPPRRKRELRPSTARRYQWYVENYITPAIGAHRAAPWKSQPRPHQADAPSISTPTPNRSSRDGVAGKVATGTPSEFTIRCSRTNTANRPIPNRSANSSISRHSAADCRESSSTTCDTRTRHTSRRSWRTHQGRVRTPRSCPPPASRWRPINTCCLVWAQRPQPTSLPCSPPQVNPRRQCRRSDAWWSIDDLPHHRRVLPGQRLEVARAGRRSRSTTLRPEMGNARKRTVSGHFIEWRGQDLNLRPSGYEP